MDHTAVHQESRLDAHPPKRALPDRVGGAMENELRLRRRDQPCAGLDFLGQLPWAPTRVPQIHAEVGRRIVGDQFERFQRVAEPDAVDNVFGFGALVLRGMENECTLGLNRPTFEDCGIRAIPVELHLLRLAEARDIELALFVDNQTHRAVFVVLQNEHHPARKVGIGHLGYRDQKNRGGKLGLDRHGAGA